MVYAGHMYDTLGHRQGGGLPLHICKDVGKKTSKHLRTSAFQVFTPPRAQD